jgi:hypothetical protein
MLLRRTLEWLFRVKKLKGCFSNKNSSFIVQVKLRKLILNSCIAFRSIIFSLSFEMKDVKLILKIKDVKLILIFGMKPVDKNN